MFITMSTELDVIINFLKQIGIACHLESLSNETFLPGIAIRNGELIIDAEKVLYPGDILHEAGHLAVVSSSERKLLNGNVGETKENQNALGEEMMAIGWSYAAAYSIGLDANVVFHPQGYKGQSDWFLEQFENGHYTGLHLLVWIGLCDYPKAETGGYPKMNRWLRE